MGLTWPDRAVAAAGGTVLSWASAFPAISVAVGPLGAPGLSVARLVVASVALACVMPFMKVRRPRSRDLPLIGLCGLSGMTIYQLLLNAGEQTVPAGPASLLIATAPIYSALIAAALLGERSTARRSVGSAIAFAGSAVIAASHGLGFGASALVVLAAAVAQATYHTAQKPLLARYTGMEVTVYATWSGTLFILPWAGSLVRALPHVGASAIGSAVFLGNGRTDLGTGYRLTPTAGCRRRPCRAHRPGVALRPQRRCRTRMGHDRDGRSWSARRHPPRAGTKHGSPSATNRPRSAPAAASSTSRPARPTPPSPSTASDSRRCPSRQPPRQPKDIPGA